MPPQISIVSPVYGCAATLESDVRRLKALLEQHHFSCEIILVDDGSRDDGWAVIQRRAAADPVIKGIRLSRNFGQHAAVTAGIAHATGRYTFVIDCDFPHDLHDILKLYEALRGGDCEIVFAVRDRRRQELWKKLLSKAYAWLFKQFATPGEELPFGPLVGFSEKVRKAFLEINDYNRSYIILLHWLGFPKKYITVSYDRGRRGKTSYSFVKLLAVAANAWVAQSTRVLYFSISLAFLFSLLTALGIAYVVIRYFMVGFLPGWASLITAIFFATSVILFQLGIIGLYVGKTFEQVRGRPLYVIDETVNV